MHDIIPNTNEAQSKAQRKSIVESFTITNLHGYRTISLQMEHAATIVIAQNGAGKTTLMNAMDAFLRGQFSRLRSIQFDEIRCKISNIEEEFVLRFQDIQDLANLSAESEIVKFSKRVEIEQDRVFSFVANEYTVLRDDYSAISDEPVFEAATRQMGYSFDKTKEYLDRLHGEVYGRNPRLFELKSALNKALDGVEILYLPTYRRVEIPLVNSKADERQYRKRRARFKMPYDMFSGDIEFGLSDISARLARLNSEIVMESNRGYRKISADIINELIDGTFASKSERDFDTPSSEDLELLFSRLKEGSRVGPFSQVTVPDLEKVLQRLEQDDNTNRFLRYFLEKLNSVMLSTKDVESQVEDFIFNCNRYLRQYDLGLGDIHLNSSQEIDSKELKLRKSDMSVYAVSIPTQRNIPLDFLSSGEKQMISLFAKLYLYPKRKIVLIDEPELSLSLDWQRQILPDVVNAPKCDQLVAITHSPFVFDNILEPYARSMSIVVNTLSLEPASVLGLESNPEQ